jgi:hypothetical protein
MECHFYIFFLSLRFEQNLFINIVRGLCVVRQFIGSEFSFLEKIFVFLCYGVNKFLIQIFQKGTKKFWNTRQKFSRNVCGLKVKGRKVWISCFLF